MKSSMHVMKGVPFRDVGRAIRWLTEIFGVRVIRSWGPQDNPVFAYLSYRTGVFSVAVRPSDDNAWSAVGPVSIGFTATDEETVKRAYDRAIAAGAEVVRELGFQRNPAVPDGYLGFTLRDREGNLWDMASDSPTFEITDV